MLGSYQDGLCRGCQEEASRIDDACLLQKSKVVLFLQMAGLQQQTIILQSCAPSQMCDNLLPFVDFFHMSHTMKSDLRDGMPGAEACCRTPAHNALFSQARTTDYL